jgi:hypothetical protein
MTKFDEFCSSLLEESKRFLEKANETKNDKAKHAYYHSSILLGISALEAYINGIASDIVLVKDVPIIEKALLSEKDIELRKGTFKLTNRLKIYRLSERIEYLYNKFSGHQLDSVQEKWWSDLKFSLQLRNNLVHPKDEIPIDKKQVEKLLKSVINCLTCLSKFIYGKEFPFKNLGLQSKLTF